MVRLADLPDYEQAHLLEKSLPPLGPAQWMHISKPLREMRIALVTTAGMHFRGDPSFEFADATFRPISGEDGDDLVMSHSSVNFDKTGFTEDINVVFPIDRFKELVSQDENTITVKNGLVVLPSAQGVGFAPWATRYAAIATAWVIAACTFLDFAFSILSKITGDVSRVASIGGDPSRLRARCKGVSPSTSSLFMMTWLLLLASNISIIAACP